MFSISHIKEHANAFLHSIGASVDSDMARLLGGFTQFIEGKQAEADAKAYLEKRGYTVTVPPNTGPLPTGEPPATPGAEGVG